MGFELLCLFVCILNLNCIYNLDVVSQSVYIPALETHFTSDNEELTHDLRIRSRRQLVSAAPVFKDPENLFEQRAENKVLGSSVIIKCEPTGTPTPNITWYKDNITPVQRTDHGGTLPVTYDMWSLMLDDLVLEDNGNYTCRLCNQFGCVKHVRQLKIITGYPKLFPRIMEGYPGNKTVAIHNSVEMSCPTVNHTEYGVKWLKRLDPGADQIVSGEVVNQKGKYAIWDDTLTITDAARADEGWYVCITNNTIGSDNATGFLRVTVADSLPTNGEPVKNGISTVLWLTPTLSILLIISLIIVVVICLKFRRERIMKQHAEDTAREVMFEQWMKVVSVETGRSNGYTPTGTLQMPKVNIQRQKLSDILNQIPSYVHTPESEYVIAVDSKWEIDRRLLTLGDVIGEGEFGRVVIAQYQESKTDMPSTVAVKMLKDGHSDADMISFVSEVEIMKMIGNHENIINLVGCCTIDGPFYAVVEYATNGCLRDYLRRLKSRAIKNEDSTKDVLLQKQTELVEFTLQVAKGMEYLSSRGCVHRDLAARNVLVSGARVLKVADFGLARDVRDSDYYRKRTAGKLPVRWMAPESLCHNYYTMKSDVWAFGVLSWEIMTYGSTPYANIPPHFLYNYLRQGKRLERPENCSEDMYQLMQHCCTFNPDERPTFTELREKLELILNADKL